MNDTSNTPNLQVILKWSYSRNFPYNPLQRLTKQRPAYIFYQLTAGDISETGKTILLK